MNKVVLIGRITKDPELRFIPSGTAVTSIFLAVDRKFQQKESEKIADFIPVTIWGKQAENTVNYVGKGCKISISGRIQTKNYEDKDGNKRSTFEIVAEDVEFIEWSKDKSKSDFNSPSNDQFVNYGNMPTSDDDMILIDDEDVPF